MDGFENFYYWIPYFVNFNWIPFKASVVEIEINRQSIEFHKIKKN